MSICACRCVAPVDQPAPSTAAQREARAAPAGTGSTMTLTAATVATAAVVPQAVLPVKAAASILHVWAWYDFSWDARATDNEVSPATEIEPSKPSLEHRHYKPVFPFALRGATLATEGHSIAILRDGELQQDGLYSRHPPRQDSYYGQIRALAGSWPQKAYALFERQDTGERVLDVQLLLWKNGAWEPLRTLGTKQALLIGNEAGKVFLAESMGSHGTRGASLRQIDGPNYTLTPGEKGCTTRLVAPASLETNGRGDLLLRGEDCAHPNQAALEFWRAASTSPKLLTPELDLLNASTLDGSSNVWVAGQKQGHGGTAVLRFDGEAWSTQAWVAGDGIASMSVDSGGRLWIVVKHKEHANELMQLTPPEKAAGVELPANVGSPQWIKFVHGKLWVSAERALLSLEPPMKEWDWIDVGIPYPLTYATRRASAWRGTCSGNVFAGDSYVVVYDKSKAPDWGAWSKKYNEMKRIRAFRVAPRENRPNFEARRETVPIVALEGSTYWFGFSTSDYTIVNAMTHPYPANGTAPVALCANPTSLSMRRITELLKAGN